MTLIAYSLKFERKKDVNEDDTVGTNGKGMLRTILFSSFQCRSWKTTRKHWMFSSNMTSCCSSMMKKGDKLFVLDNWSKQCYKVLKNVQWCSVTFTLIQFIQQTKNDIYISSTDLRHGHTDELVLSQNKGQKNCIK